VRRGVTRALLVAVLAGAAHAGTLVAVDAPRAEATLAIPAAGARELRVIAPTVLELMLVSGAESPWSFGPARPLPAADAFQVTVGGRRAAVAQVGFRRRAVYAPDRVRDLRVGNHLFLRLAAPVPDGATVEVANPDGALWAAATTWRATADPRRPSPAVHVNQEGYIPGLPKRAMAGYDLGTLGELEVPASRFQLLDGAGKVAFEGPLTARRETGQAADRPAPYQRVMQADFSRFDAPGTYRLRVPGLGTSYPFRIDDGLAADYARTYALGLYGRRCGAENALPFSRFTHAACHRAPVQVPDASCAPVREYLARWAHDDADAPYQTAPPLDGLAASLFPFVYAGPIDAHGGHHDAGDYSRYTVDGAQLVHHLCFAADNVPGAGALDNLGIPESGDGRSDLLQEAAWEADFLCRIQDSDGGFPVLVYPRDTAYEWDVTCDQSTYAQVVYPKNTIATASATAALAQLATSPVLRAQAPADAARYADAAARGWRFLKEAWARHGRRGAYQVCYPYGTTFHDQDEIAWCEVEMYLLTRDPAIHRLAQVDLAPDPAHARWGWWRLFESYGCATRDYAFAARSGRVPASALDARLLAACTEQIAEAGQDQVHYVDGSAYGCPYPFADKRYGNAGWFTPGERCFDLVVAQLLSPSPKYVDAILSAIAYEQGCNPVSISLVTGMGWQRQHEMVDQQSKNDRYLLPVSGIPLGAFCDVEPYLGTYGTALRDACYPGEKDPARAYPMNDRWTDTWNVHGEIVTCLAARALAAMSWLMTQRPAIARQSWRAAPASIALSRDPVAGAPVTATLTCRGMDLAGATRVVWEAGTNATSQDEDAAQTPGACPAAFAAAQVRWTPSEPGAGWISAEAQWPDGRRAFAIRESPVGAPGASTAAAPGGVAIAFGMNLTSTITAISNRTVRFENYGLACEVPYDQATFLVGGAPLTLDHLAPGQTCSIQVRPFSGKLAHITGNRVTFDAPSGAVTVAAQTLSVATRQALHAGD